MKNLVIDSREMSSESLLIRNSKTNFYYLFLLVFLFLLPYHSYAATQQNTVFTVNDAKGVAPVIKGDKAGALKLAREDAYRDSLRKSIGELVYGVRGSEEILENNVVYSKVRDKIFRKANGIVKEFKIIDEKIEKMTDPKTGEDIYTMRITATCKVSVLALDGVLGPEVIDAMGNPRILILIDEQISGKKSSLSAAEAETIRVFEKAGYTLLSSRRADINPALIYDAPEKWKNSTGSSGAEVLVLGKAKTSHVLKEKHGPASIYRVNADVQLKAVVSETGHQIASNSAKNSTDSTQPAGAGASKSLTSAASSASKEMIHKIAYALAFNAQVAVNIKINNISFKEVETILKALQRLAGREGGVYERGYSNQSLEIDFVSIRSSRDIASYLSEQAIEIESFTSHTIVGRMVR